MTLFRRDTEPVRPGYAVARLACRLAFSIYFRGRILHADRVPPRGGVLLAANHQSYLDPVVGGVGIPRECSFIARETLFRNPYFGRLIRYVNAFPVRRGEADVTAVKELLRRLRDGKVVMIFPEGTRSVDGELKPLNPNSLEMGRRAKVPIVPLLIDGSFRAFPRGHAFPRPYRIHVVYGEPVTPEDMEGLASEALVEIVTTRLRAALEESRELRRLRP